MPVFNLNLINSGCNTAFDSIDKLVEIVKSGLHVTIHVTMHQSQKRFNPVDLTFQF